jgi:thioredoxin reductase
MSQVRDVIVVGAGPSGLMAGITACRGTPFVSAGEGQFADVLILDSYCKPGGIAAFGSLAITNTWSMPGGRLKSYLVREAKTLPLDLHVGRRVTRVGRSGDCCFVEVDDRRLAARSVIIACGIFPTLEFLKFRNVFFMAQPVPVQAQFARALAAWAEEYPAAPRKLLVFGSHERVAETAQRWRAEAPSLEIECMAASLHDPGGASAINRLLAELRTEPAKPSALTGDWADPDGLQCVDYLALVLDYNTFKVRPETTASILDGSGVTTRQGYIPTDNWGRTDVPGIFACGNVIFPVSGVLQALYSGFVAGLASRKDSSVDGFDVANGFLPWLAFPNDTWAEWLEPADDQHHQASSVRTVNGSGLHMQCGGPRQGGTLPNAFAEHFGDALGNAKLNELPVHN